MQDTGWVNHNRHGIFGLSTAFGGKRLRLDKNWTKYMLLIGLPDVDLLLSKTLTDRITVPILTVKYGIKFIKEAHAIL